MMPSNIPVANIMGFQCEFMKYSKGLHSLNTDLTVHYFMVAVARQAKGRLLKEDILLNAFKIARSVGVDSVTYICTSRNDQERAKRVGFMASTYSLFHSITASNILYYLQIYCIISWVQPQVSINHCLSNIRVG